MNFKNEKPLNVVQSMTKISWDVRKVSEKNLMKWSVNKTSVKCNRINLFICVKINIQHIK